MLFLGHSSWVNQKWKTPLAGERGDPRTSIPPLGLIFVCFSLSLFYLSCLDQGETSHATKNHERVQALTCGCKAARSAWTSSCPAKAMISKVQNRLSTIMYAVWKCLSQIFYHRTFLK